MRTGNGNVVFLRFLYGTCCHDVRNGGSKQNNQICLSNLGTEIPWQLCEHLAFAVEFLADVHILTNHAVVTAHDNNARVQNLLCYLQLLAIANFVSKLIVSVC